MGWGDSAPAIVGARPLSDGDLPCRPRHEVTRLTHSGHACLLLDHLVGDGKQRPGDGEAEGLRSPGVDQKAEFGRLLDRQVRRLGTLENLGDIIESYLTKGAHPVVAHQTAFPGVRGLRIYRGNFVTRRQRQNFWAIVEGKWKSADDECAGLTLDKGRKSCLEVAVAATFQDNDVQPKRACRRR